MSSSVMFMGGWDLGVLKFHTTIVLSKIIESSFFVLLLFPMKVFIFTVAFTEYLYCIYIREVSTVLFIYIY